ncbi:MAG: hypothetical protein AAGC88_08005 [Bacteroidota bacterium]
MSKRQKRIPSTELAKHKDQLLGQKVSVVLKDKSVIYVQLLSFKNDTFEAKDLILRKHKIELESIDEMILELDA